MKRSPVIGSACFTTPWKDWLLLTGGLAHGFAELASSSSACRAALACLATVAFDAFAAPGAAPEAVWYPVRAASFASFLARLCSRRFFILPSVDALEAAQPSPLQPASSSQSAHQPSTAPEPHQSHAPVPSSQSSPCPHEESSPHPLALLHSIGFHLAASAASSASRAFLLAFLARSLSSVDVTSATLADGTASSSSSLSHSSEAELRLLANPISPLGAGAELDVLAFFTGAQPSSVWRMDTCFLTTAMACP
mmetsp:Transcript_21132/g.46581  ORF Transcript_21132/g.46581 Transcript_21132/m.46581 type:complete len:252 (+) Transcript_21132:953-1708(+)